MEPTVVVLQNAGSVEGQHFHEGPGGLGDCAYLGEVVQQFVGAVCGTHHGEGGAGGQLVQQNARGGGPGTVGLGNGVAVGVVRGGAQEAVQAADEFRTLDVFEFFGEVVHFVPAKAQGFCQKDFPEAVPADDGGGRDAAGIGQGHTLVAFVVHQAFFGQALQHVRGAGGLGLHAVGQGVGANAGLGQGKNGLEVVFFGGGESGGGNRCGQSATFWMGQK